ncbi:MAG: DHA2 family efflux MFS transporter permease subunit [Pseudomonadota bacterium]
MNLSQEKIPTLKLVLITLAVMSATIIEILDLTIVNVSLAPMMGSLGANSDQITWVMTSYIVSAAIVMPLTGFLVSRFGQRDLLLLSISGFLIASVLCGLATSLSEIVFFRTLQGICGASLVPLSQAILTTTFPKEKVGLAMAIWAVGIMAGPVLGPTLGGYITYNLDWRWIFFVNVPVCIFSFVMTFYFIEQTPVEKRHIDWWGLFLMITGIGALQIFLDRGSVDDWFQSSTIILLFFTGVFSLGLLIYRCLKIENPILNLRLFLDRNLALCSFIVAFIFANAFAVLALQPILLENYFSYPSETVGLILAPRGIASAILMMTIHPLIKFINGRWLMMIGISFSAIANISMAHFNLATAPVDWIYMGILQGLGMGFLMVPIMTFAYKTIPDKLVAEASGLFNLCRSLGSSIGISILITLVTRENQINWNHLSGFINAYNPHLQAYVHKLGMSLSDPRALPIIAQQISAQVGMISYNDAFYVVGISVLILLIFVPFLDRIKSVIKVN